MTTISGILIRAGIVIRAIHIRGLVVLVVMLVAAGTAMTVADDRVATVVTPAAVVLVVAGRMMAVAVLGLEEVEVAVLVKVVAVVRVRLRHGWLITKRGVV